ncbi:MAG: sugar nucleotide-binding protein, partial [Bdellovibrionota bacterium]
MKIAIVGTTGMLGYAMSKYLRAQHIQVIEVSRDNYNIAEGQLARLEEIIKEADIVINGAGIVKPLIPNYPIEEVLKINSIFPRNLSILCQKNGKKMFHITTDCVYSGKNGNYSEEDYFDAEDVYGLSKN